MTLTDRTLVCVTFINNLLSRRPGILMACASFIFFCTALRFDTKTLWLQGDGLAGRPVFSCQVIFTNPALFLWMCELLPLSVSQIICFTSLGVWSCGKMLPLYQLRCAYCATVTLNLNPPKPEVAMLAVKDAAARSEAQRRDPCLHVAPPGIYPECLPVDFISFMCLSVAMKSCSKANKGRGR